MTITSSTFIDPQVKIESNKSKVKSYYIIETDKVITELTYESFLTTTSTSGEIKKINFPTISSAIILCDTLNKLFNTSRIYKVVLNTYIPFSYLKS